MNHTPTTRRAVLGGVAGLALLGLTACGGSSDPMATSAAPSSSAAGASAAAGTSGKVVVGSANFPESELLMNLYAGALKAKGVDVDTKPNIGSRETYLPALEKGEINVMPEYTGMVLAHYAKDAVAKDPEDVYQAMKKAIPAGLTVFAKSAAEDKDSVVVTKETAEKYKLKTIADLAPVAGELVLGGPPEWKVRESGVPGLKKDYGLTFKSFQELDTGGPLSVQALKTGRVQAANLFSTDPNIAANDFVVLEDPKAHFTAQNVVPLVTKAKADGTVTAALDAVSAQLDTASLSELVKKVVIDHEDADAVANDWLKAKGLA